MAAEERGSGAKRPRRRRALAFGCAGLVALLAGAVLLRDAWLEPLAMRYVRERARELGAELTIERISGGWFGDVTLEGVSWRSARPPLFAVREARVELAYTLYGAWKGEPELAVRLRASGIDLALGAEGTDAGGTGGGLPELAALELDLAELLVRLPGREPERIDSLRGRGSLRGGTARAAELALVAGPNRLDFADVELDTSRRGWLEIARGARGELVVTLEDTQVLEDLLGRELGLRSAELTLAAEHGTASVRGQAALANGRLEIARGELRLPEQGGLEELQLDLGLAAEIADLAPFEEVFGQPLEGRWEGAIDVRGPVRAPIGRFVGRGEALRAAGLAFDFVDLDVETDGKMARLERCEISGPELEAVLRGGLSLSPLELVDVAVNVSADRTPLAVLLPFPCEHAFFHARLDGPPRAPRGAFELSAEGVQVGGVLIDDAESRGTIAADVLEVAEVRLTSGESFVEAAGTLRRAGTDFTADLGRLAIAWREASAELEHGARLEFGKRRFAVEGLELSSESGGETGRARIALRHEDGVTRGSLDFERYDAGPLLAPFLPEGWKAGRTSGHVEGELGAGGSGGTPAVTLDLALAGWSVSPAWPELEAELRGGFDGHALALERVDLGFSADEGVRAHGSLRVPFDPRAPLSFGAGPVELALELETHDAAVSLRRAGLEPGARSTGTCRLALDLTGEWRSLAGSAALRAADVRFGNGNLEQTCDLEARLALGERVRLERSLLSAPSGTIALSGELGIPLDLPRWTSDRWVLLEAPLALDAEIEHADLAWITGLSDALRRVSGRLAGRVSMHGTALEPEFGGALALREGEFRLAARNAPPVRDVSADLTLDGDVVNVVTLTGDVGGAPVRVSGTLEPFGPFPRLDIELDGKNLLLARNSRLVLRADLDLVVKGTPSQLAIRGDMAVAEGRYTTEFSPFEEILRRGRRGGGEARREARFALATEGLLADAELDVHICGQRTFEYRSNLLEASVRPDLRLQGTGSFPVFEGPMYVEEASLSLPSGSLKTTSGILTFAPETGLVPEVALTAESRIARHTVRASITGPLNGPLEIVLSSSPPLAQDDLWLLVLTGQLPPETASDRGSQALEALATFLAQDTLVRWFGTDQEDAESLLERFEIDVGARTSQSGQRTGRVLFYLRTPDPRSGRATYLSAERDEYDRYNYALGIVFRPR